VEDTPKGYAYFKILHDFFKALPWYEYKNKPISRFHGSGAQAKDKGCIFFSKEKAPDLQIFDKHIKSVQAMNIYTGEKTECKFDNNYHSHEKKPTIYNPFDESYVIYTINFE